MIDGELCVILRTCEGKSMRGAARPYGLDKTQVIKACFRSLRDSMLLGHFPRPHLHIIDDGSSDELRKWLEGFHDYDKRPILHCFENLGGNGSFAEALKLIEALKLRDEDYVYLCEDDYFYSSDCFWQMRDFLDLYSGHVFLSPYHQHLWLTRTMQVRQAGTERGYDICSDVAEAVKGVPTRQALMGSHCWWMQLYYTTLTFMARMGTLRKHWPTILETAVDSNDGHLSTCYQIDSCYTPIPGLASHFQEGCETPYFTDHLVGRRVKDMAQ